MHLNSITYVLFKYIYILIQGFVFLYQFRDSINTILTTCKLKNIYSRMHIPTVETNLRDDSQRTFDFCMDFSNSTYSNMKLYSKSHI